MVGTATGLHANEAVGQIDEKGRHLLASERFVEHGPAILIDAVDLKHILDQIGVVAQMPVAAEVGSGDERDELGSG